MGKATLSFRHNESYKHANTPLIQLFDISHGPAHLRLMHCPRQKNKICFCLFYPKRSKNKLNQSAQNVFNTVFHHRLRAETASRRLKSQNVGFKSSRHKLPSLISGHNHSTFPNIRKITSHSWVLQGSKHQSFSSIFLRNEAAL